MAKLHKQDKKMIGVLLSEYLYNGFTLIMLAENSSKTKLGESIIEGFVRNYRKKVTETDLLLQVRGNVIKEWRACKTKNGMLSQFKETLRFQLQAEGLTAAQIDTVLDFEDDENN